MFLAMGLPPIEITTIQLEANNQSQIADVEVRLTEKVKISLDKPYSRCKNYEPDESSFNQCNQDYFKDLYKMNMTCLIPGDKNLLLYLTNKTNITGNNCFI
jgi:hypothetical protein